MAGHSYNVPVILPDLRREESYRQIVDALEYLDAVSSDIFNRISFRIAENRDQLTGLNNRIFTAQAKIDKLRSTSTKATQVFSSPKYPAPDKIPDYQTIYHEVDPALHKVRKIRDPIESRLPEVTLEVMRAKSKPYPLHLRQLTTRQERAIMDDDPELEGLGSLPKNLPSVSSLLLFNTTENPYKKYVLRDPLEGAKTKTRDNMAEEENKLHEAPETIARGVQLERGQKDSLMYVPIMPELPELDVPDMLPSLQYIASDMYYQGDAGASIAPSVASIIPELPNLADPEAPAAQETPALPPPVEDVGAPPPPPPPPPAPIEAPPLPTVLEEGEEVSSDEEGGSGGDDLGGGGDDRANLMEAIRKAGGASKAGLKKSKDRKMKRKAKKEESAEMSGGGGDLLNDLSAALGRRRKAMSGKDKGDRKERKEEHSLGGGSMLDNMSRMIPTFEGSTKEDSDDGEGWTA